MRHPLQRKRSVLGAICLVLALIAGLFAALAAVAPEPAAAAPLPYDTTVATVAGNATQCPPGTTRCVRFEVECPSLPASTGFYAVRDRTSGPNRGTIVLFSGGGGNTFFGDDEKGDGKTSATLLFNALRAQGFKIVQVRWNDSWEQTAPGLVAGAAVGCRPASIVHHLRTAEFAKPSGQLPGICGFCIAGSSGGSAQVAYTISHFGLDGELDGVFPISGPTHAAVAKGCSNDRVHQDYRYDGPSTRRLDGPLGFGAGSGPFATANGPCKNRQSHWEPEFTALAVDTGANDRVHDTTRVHVIIGEKDPLRSHAKDYVVGLWSAGSPWVSLDMILGMGHNFSKYNPGPENDSLDDFPGPQHLYDALVLDDPTRFPACNNGLDDDRDGDTDLDDGGCTGLQDSSELGSAPCDDGLDNDGDGRSDFSKVTAELLGDPGCASPADDNEKSEPDEAVQFPCDDGLDGADGDDLVDFPADPGCSSPEDLAPAGDPELGGVNLPCDDGVDNDGDGLTDFPADPDCVTPDTASESLNVRLELEELVVPEGSGGGATAVPVKALLSTPNPGPDPVTVNWSTSPVSALGGGIDFDATPGTLSFAQGEQEKTFHVQIVKDSLDEVDEWFLVRLQSPSAGLVLDRKVLNVTIVDDDGPPAVSVSGGSVAEGHSGTKGLPFTVSLSKASGRAVAVGYATADGSAKASDDDYVPDEGTVIFEPGATSKTVDVLVKGDTAIEPNETLTLHLSSPLFADLGSPSSAQGTIENDDQPLSQLSITGGSVVEGNGSSRNLTMTVTLSPASNQSVQVAWKTRNGSARAGEDYTAKSGSITFSPGVTSKPIKVSVLGDTKVEPDETFFVDLSNAVNATIANGTGTGTILNDDSASGGAVTISVNDASVTEGDAGTVKLRFTVKLSASSTKTITVRYATGGGNATEGTDYVKKSALLTFDPGQTSKTVGITVNGDTVKERNETFNVTLSQPSNATISDGTGVMTIIDDD